MSVTYRRHPDFIVIGGLCCATSALTAILRQRPEIALRGNSQDLRDDLYLGNVERDLSRFSNIFSNLDPNKLCGAVMPHYLSLPGVAEDLREQAPDTRLVVVLRDPLERLRSHYLYNVAGEYETFPFEVSIQQEENRCGESDPQSIVRYGYLRQGRYAELLEPFRDAFGPEQMHIIYTPDLLENTDQELMLLYKFLGFMKTHDIVLKRDTDWTSSADLYRQSVDSPYPSLYRALGGAGRKLGRQGSGQASEQGLVTRIGRSIANSLHPLPGLKKESRNWLRNYFLPHDEALTEWLGAPPPWHNQAPKEAVEPAAETGESAEGMEGNGNGNGKEKEK